MGLLRDFVFHRYFSSSSNESRESVTFIRCDPTRRLSAFVVDAERDQALIFEIMAQPFDIRQRGHAAAAPTAPEIEQHDIASELLQLDLISIQVIQREIYRVCSHDAVMRRRGGLRIRWAPILSGAGNYSDNQNERDGGDIFHSRPGHSRASFSFLPSLLGEFKV